MTANTTAMDVEARQSQRHDRCADPARLNTVPPRILIVDHHDSYTHNLLISLLDALATDDEAHSRARLSAELLVRTLVLPHTHPIWQDRQAVQRHLLPNFDALILGPGPGRADVEADFGASRMILNAILHGESTHHGDSSSSSMPTLGICLGHQGLAVACGAKIKRAKHLRHGLASRVDVTEHDGSTRWPGILQARGTDRQYMMTTYNSLVVDETTIPSELVITGVAFDGTISSSQSQDRAGQDASSDKVVMALQHVTLPMWGVQFHPESIASQGGHLIMRNFLRNCQEYWCQQSFDRHDTVARSAFERLKVWRQCQPLPSWVQKLGRASLASTMTLRLPPSLMPMEKRFRVISHPLGKFDCAQAPSVFRTLFTSTGSDLTNGGSEAAVWLDSARPGGIHSRYSSMSKPAWTIGYDIETSSVLIKADGTSKTICLPDQGKEKTKLPSPTVVQQHGLQTPKASRTSSPETIPTGGDRGDLENEYGFWTWFNELQQAIEINTDVSSIAAIPFRTGFVGYFGYEMKAESLPALRTALRKESMTPCDAKGGIPSAWFGFCDRVIVIDHESGEWYALGLICGDQSVSLDAKLQAASSILSDADVRLGCTKESFMEWSSMVKGTLDQAASQLPEPADTSVRLPALTPVDDPASYKAKIEKARELIAEGQSYELCLTTEFRGRLEGAHSSPFHIYTSLRRRNPAPYSAFLQLDGQRSILSTSPEKFFGLSKQGVVEMKPIKGTSARAGHAKGEQTYLEGARAGDAACVQWCAEEDDKRKKALQADAKERAENLMIVDLIRRDLLSFCSSDSVTVPTLMGIESYETVHQLVTTVQGRKTDGVGAIEALRRCFPPGSMTGAPKVRSVELLERLEHVQSEEDRAVQARTGRGIYSGVLGWIGVDGAANFNVVIRTVFLDGQNVSVGAGGAITYHSNANGEWQEVLDKVGAIASVEL